MDSSLRGCSHVVFDSHSLQPKHSSGRILDRKKTNDARKVNKLIYHSQYQFFNDIPVLLWQVRAQLTKLY